MATAFVLAALTLTGVVEPWHIIVLSVINGAVGAVDIPTRQAFLSELVGTGDDLANAIALNSSVFNGARLVGPSLAAVALTLTSPGVCFLVNGFSFLAVLAALFAMKLPSREARDEGRGARDEENAFAPASLVPRPSLASVREGLVYAWKSGPIRSLLVLIALFNMAGLAGTTLLPIVATAVLGGDARTLAMLWAGAGFGAFAAAVVLACRRSVVGLTRWIGGATVIFSVGILAFSFAENSWLAVLLLMVAEFALLLMTAGANTILQMIVAEDKRGRVMSLYTTAVTGCAPLGGLLAGWMADHFGAPMTLRLAGLGCLVVSVVFAIRSKRPPGTRAQSVPKSSEHFETRSLEISTR